MGALVYERCKHGLCSPTSDDCRPRKAGSIDAKKMDRIKQSKGVESIRLERIIKLPPMDDTTPQ